MVGQRLMNLSNLPNYTGSPEYSGQTAVATASHPPNFNHYNLPNLRTKGDLQSIDQFLEQLQSTVYEQSETASQAASAGVAQPGGHYVHAALNVRSSHSPPRPLLASSSHMLPAVTATASDSTPALTPASTTMSQNSPGSVHSATISPVHRPSNPMYPSVVTSTIAEATAAYTTTSGATMTATYDHNGRYHAGRLQKARPSSPDILPNIDRLGMRSPSLSNVDPALVGDARKKSASGSPLDPALRQASSGPEDPDWIVKVRTLEAIRNMIKARLESHEYEESSDGMKTPKIETEEESEARSLYPVIRAIRGQD